MKQSSDESTSLNTQSVFQPQYSGGMGGVSKSSILSWTNKRPTKFLSLSEKRKKVWGEEPKDIEPDEEEKTNWFGFWYYTWLTDDVFKAAKAEFPKSKNNIVRPIMRRERAQRLSTMLSMSHDKQQKSRELWDLFLGHEVRRKDDSKSRGVLLWIGYLQISSSPRKLRVGVEWSYPPRLYRNTPEIYHHGVVDGEQLFDAPSGYATCEVPDDIQFVYSFTEVAENDNDDIDDETTALNPKSSKKMGRNGGYGCPRTTSLFSSLYDSFGCRYLFAGIPKLTSDICTLTGPVILQIFVQYLANEDPTWKQGLGLVAAFFLLNLIQSAVLHKFFHITIRIGLAMRNACIGVIFDKSLKLSSKTTSIPEMNAGRIVNMVSGDTERIDDAAWFMHFIWSSPLQIVVAVILMYRLVGWAAFSGVSLMLLTMPAQAFVMRLQFHCRQRLLKCTDKRIKATNELFSGIRIVKFMVWEKKFVETITHLRELEMAALRDMIRYRVTNTFLVNASPVFVTAGVFISYHLGGHRLTPEIVFPTIALLGILRFPFFMIPMLMTTFINCKVSLDRIGKFLECEEQQDDILLVDQLAQSDRDVLALTTRQGVQGPQTSILGREDQREPLAAAIMDATLSAYTPAKLDPPSREHSCCCFGGICAKCRKSKKKNDDEYFTLQPKNLLTQISARFPRGKLTIICGPVGCGKSTLLDSLMGSLEITHGRILCEKSIAYVPQQPWILNATVKNNILFFEEYDEKRFQRVIESCELTADVETLINGVETEIGERGVNLSGGQKARVSLARAVYSRRNMLLLDDPLSAVDAHVGERLMNHCFLEVLSDTTRVLVTHHEQYLPSADHIIIIGEKGKIFFQGNFNQYVQFKRMQSASLTEGPGMSAATLSSSFCGGSPTPAFPEVPVEKSVVEGTAEKEKEEDEDEENDKPVDDNIDGKPLDETVAEGKGEGGKEAEKKKVNILMTEEEKASGHVPVQTYKMYFLSCGGCWTVVGILLLFAITECISASSSVWLSFWSVQKWGISQDTYLYVYCSLIGTQAFSAAARAYCTYMSMRVASLNLHKSLLQSVSLAPVSFFDTTPLGRVLNRFAKDVDSLDNDLPMNWLSVLNLAFQICSTLAIMIASNPICIIALIPAGYGYFRILKFYNAANRETKRIAAVVKSPIFAMLTEVLSGSRTIVAYGHVKEILIEACTRLDALFSASYFRNTMNRWLGVRIEFIGNCVVTTVAFAAVLVKMLNFGNHDLALLSLGLTLSLRITDLLNYIVRTMAGIEANMNAVERIAYYAEKLPQEENWEYDQPDSAPRPGTVAMPSAISNYRYAPVTHRATISFDHVSLRYRPNLPLVLNDISFQINDREKVGIIGRTGSGKSTLMLTFLRIIDISSGAIRVGGAPIQDFTLRDLRLRFAMIPQDPLLFEGSVRSNLDPFNEVSDDAELWSALDKVGMSKRIRENVTEAGQKNNTQEPGASEPQGGESGVHVSNPLDSPILDGGKNFSVGQRQLLCLARALIRKESEFILMDEATANIDPEMDAFIQKTVRTAFSDKTVITIAHRLNTILHCDKLIVMKKDGIVGEIGKPYELAHQKDSLLKEMISAHGQRAEKKLMKQLELLHERAE